MSWKMLAAALLAVCAYAEQPPVKHTVPSDKAPAEVDQALRARVTEYLQFFVDGKFRRAEALVAEDSKDFYYDMNKRRYFSFKLMSIQYNEEFTDAEVTYSAEIEFTMPPAGAIRTHAPMNSTWKLENGQWCWYVLQQEEIATPFGKMKVDPNAPRSGLQMPGMAPVNVASVMSAVKADQEAVRLSAGRKSTAEVSFSNSAGGVVALSVVAPPLAGFSAALDRKELKHGESARLSLTYEPSAEAPPSTVTVTVVVEPTTQQIPVKVEFAGASAASK